MFRVPPLSASDLCVLSSRETYNALTNWLTDARTLASPNIVIILCGNKKDLDADREVTFLEASRFAQENGDSCLICIVPLSFSVSSTRSLSVIYDSLYCLFHHLLCFSCAPP